jgi:cell division protein FtsI/penicillin-binding protein 2
MHRTYIIPWRYYLACLCLVIAFMVVVGRLVDLHVVRAEALRAEALSSRERILKLPAERGQIYDRNGILLAGTRSLIEVGVDPHAVGAEDLANASELANILELPLAQVWTAFAKKYRDRGPGEPPRAVRWVKLHPGVDEATYESIQALGMKAVYGNRRFVRVYPGGSLAAHVLGFQNQAGYALGVEHSMDFYLSGQGGWMETERDGRRRELAQFREREVLPQRGLDVVLTLDSVLQHFAEREILRLVKAYQPKGISILISEPSSGDLLAMANYPSFDPNHYGKAPAQAYRNRALTDIYEPGSTFKVVTVASALEAGTVTPQTVIDCGAARIQIGTRSVRLPRDSHRMQEATVAEILYKSSNRGSAHIGVRMGARALYEAARNFGYGAPTGLCLTGEFMPLEGWDGSTGEVGGILRAPHQWDGLTITTLPMGHALGATPMQVHMAMNTIASGGLRHRPRLVDRITAADGQTRLAFPESQGQQVTSEATASTVTRILAKVTQPGGTARRAAVPGYGAAGKTGTTRKVIAGQYSDKHHVASFSGFLPAWDPQLTITVIVDEPRMEQGTGYGGVVAAPAFRNIALAAAQYLGIPSEDDALTQVIYTAELAPGTAQMEGL